MKIKALLATLLLAGISTQSNATCTYADSFFVYRASTVQPTITNGPNAYIPSHSSVTQLDASSFTIRDTVDKNCPPLNQPNIADTYVSVTYATSANDYCNINIIDSPYRSPNPDASYAQCHGNLNYAGMRHASGTKNNYFVFYTA